MDNLVQLRQTTVMLAEAFKSFTSFYIDAFDVISGCTGLPVGLQLCRNLDDNNWRRLHAAQNKLTVYLVWPSESFTNGIKNRLFFMSPFGVCVDSQGFRGIAYTPNHVWTNYFLFICGHTETYAWTYCKRTTTSRTAESKHPGHLN